jgi:hypothetical protein
MDFAINRAQHNTHTAGSDAVNYFEAAADYTTRIDVKRC